MTSLTRDPHTDMLLTPENSALLLIDYQPTQITAVNSMPAATLIRNVTFTVRLAQLFQVPIVLSTVNVQNGRNQDTIPQLRQLLPNVPSLDRTSINAWQDREFLAAVHGLDRSHLVICGLWTEACLAFPTLDALAEGYQVFPVVDAVGGTSTLAHDTALARVAAAGAELTTNAQLACEWQRDWNRTATVPGFVDLLLEAGDFIRLN